MKLVRKFALWTLIGIPWFAQAQINLLSASAGELDVAEGGRVAYTVRTSQPGSVKLQLLTADGDIARTLSIGAVAAGSHEIAWDGKDDQGEAVPDEAYCPRVVLEAASSRYIDDPCSRSGGEVISGTQPSLSPEGDIAYTLDHPSRVLIRVGVRGGAMLRSISVWRPRPVGRNLQRWNGFDDTGLVDLRSDQLALSVAAFRLPEFSVITVGRDGLDYPAWRRARGWPEQLDRRAVDRAVQPLERNGTRIARQHYMARYQDREPRITVELSDRRGMPLVTGGAVPDEVRVSVDVHPDDRWLLQENLYEVAFFVDGVFLSEEENGYVPIGWIWNTGQLGPGRHLLTVNLTGFGGRVGAKTIAVSK